MIIDSISISHLMNMKKGPLSPHPFSLGKKSGMGPGPKQKLIFDFNPFLRYYTEVIMPSSGAKP